MTDDLNLSSSEHSAEPLVVQFKPSMLTWIADRNPFFLISAVCMLWGCLAVTNSSSWMSVPLSRLLVLIGTLNLYEVALIGLSLLLIHRGVLRDAKILLILEAFFLVDVAFLNAEVVTADLRVGLIVDSVLLLLAMVKLWAITKALGTSLSPARYLFIAAQLTLLMALPCVMRDIDHGAVPPIVFYAAWWAIAGMPVVGLLIERFAGASSLGTSNSGMVTSGMTSSSLTPMTRLYVVLPWISLVAHLGILHYSYDVSYFGAMASPILLVIALMLTRLTPNEFIRRRDIRVLKVLLPLAAVLVAGNEPSQLTFHLFGRSSLAISTLSVTAAGAYLTLIYGFLPTLARWLVPAGAVAAASYVFGPSADQISEIGYRVWQRFVALATAIMPNTTAGWGVVSVLASFFFLLLGAVISLGRPREES